MSLKNLHRTDIIDIRQRFVRETDRNFGYQDLNLTYRLMGLIIYTSENRCILEIFLTLFTFKNLYTQK